MNLENKPKSVRRKSRDQVSLPVGENCPPVRLASQRTSTTVPPKGNEQPVESSAASFSALFAYCKTTSEHWTITRSERSVKLAWSGVQITPSQLAELLRSLPGGRRLDGATRFGSRSASLSFDGKLRKGRLAPPTHEGIVLAWTEPQGDLSELEQAAGKAFEPEGECLGRLVLENSSQRAVARIYRDPEQRAPGFVLLRQGQVVVDNDWLETLERPEEARLCQVVIEGDLPWEGGIPSAFRGRFAKLARLAAQKSKELLQTLPAPESNRALIPALLESPKFLAATESRRSELPPVATVGQVLELLHAAGGRKRVVEIREITGIPSLRFEEILRQIDSLLRKDEEEVCLSKSLDGAWLLLHQDTLIRIFSLNPEARASDGVVSATNLEGQERSVDIPVVLEPKERRVIEALLRYGRLSERELSQVVGSRRVGGLLEKLLVRLESAGSYLLRVAGNGDDGRIFEIAS